MLQGTEKQIKFAEDLKSQFFGQLDDLVVSAEHRVEDKNMPEKWLEVTKNGVEKTKQMFSKLQTAKKVIEILYERKSVSVGRVQKLIINDYEN